MKLQISRALVDQMITHASQSPQVEVCGLLFGEREIVTSVQPCANVADDPATHFEIDPAALIAAHKAARARAAAIIGCYHSHPNGDFALSEYDKEGAEEGQIWILIARNQAAAWMMRDGQWAAFQQLT
jgi:desampylase